jgi:hypothetical protein
MRGSIYGENLDSARVDDIGSDAHRTSSDQRSLSLFGRSLFVKTVANTQNGRNNSNASHETDDLDPPPHARFPEHVWRHFAGTLSGLGVKSGERYKMHVGDTSKQSDQESLQAPAEFEAASSESVLGKRERESEDVGNPSTVAANPGGKSNSPSKRQRVDGSSSSVNEDSAASLPVPKKSYKTIAEELLDLRTRHDEMYRVVLDVRDALTYSREVALESRSAAALIAGVDASADLCDAIVHRTPTTVKPTGVGVENVNKHLRAGREAGEDRPLEFAPKQAITLRPNGLTSLDTNSPRSQMTDTECIEPAKSNEGQADSQPAAGSPSPNQA